MIEVETGNSSKGKHNDKSVDDYKVLAGFSLDRKNDPMFLTRFF